MFNNNFKLSRIYNLIVILSIYNIQCYIVRCCSYLGRVKASYHAKRYTLSIIIYSINCDRFTINISSLQFELNALIGIYIFPIFTINTDFTVSISYFFKLNIITALSEQVFHSCHIRRSPLVLHIRCDSPFHVSYSYINYNVLEINIHGSSCCCSICFQIMNSHRHSSFFFCINCSGIRIKFDT